jgi:hypothetical protein
MSSVLEEPVILHGPVNSEEQCQNMIIYILIFLNRQHREGAY